MTGRRVYELGEAGLPVDNQPGDYWRAEDGTWHGTTPNGLQAWLKNHLVIEHEDGTISVTPSILCSWGSAGKQWHGFIAYGVWREC